MRYIEIEEVTFTTQDGKDILVKEIREIPDYVPLSSYRMNKDDDVDEVISRRENYGDGAEDRAYALVEANKVKFDESNYEIDKIQGLITIPQVN